MKQDLIHEIREERENWKKKKKKIGQPDTIIHVSENKSFVKMTWYDTNPEKPKKTNMKENSVGIILHSKEFQYRSSNTVEMIV